MAVGILALAAGLTSVSRASMVEALDLPGLVGRADLIVVGQVVAQESHYDEHGRIVTDAEMLIESREKGDAARGESVVIRRLGGVVNGLGMRVEGEASYAIGQRTLLFASRLPRGDVFRAVGLSQGAMTIEERAGERWVTSTNAGAALVQRGTKGRLVAARAALPEPRRLEELLTEIRALIAKR